MKSEDNENTAILTEYGQLQLFISPKRNVTKQSQ